MLKRINLLLIFYVKQLDKKKQNFVKIYACENRFTFAILSERPCVLCPVFWVQQCSLLPERRGLYKVSLCRQESAKKNRSGASVYIHRVTQVGQPRKIKEN